MRARAASRLPRSRAGPNSSVRKRSIHDVGLSGNHCFPDSPNGAHDAPFTITHSEEPPGPMVLSRFGNNGQTGIEGGKIHYGKWEYDINGEPCAHKYTGAGSAYVSQKEAIEKVIEEEKAQGLGRHPVSGRYQMTPFEKATACRHTSLPGVPKEGNHLRKGIGTFYKTHTGDWTVEGVTEIFEPVGWLDGWRRLSRLDPMHMSEAYELASIWLDTNRIKYQKADEVPQTVKEILSYHQVTIFMTPEELREAIKPDEEADRRDAELVRRFVDSQQGLEKIRAMQKEKNLQLRYSALLRKKSTPRKSGMLEPGERDELALLSIVFTGSPHPDPPEAGRRSVAPPVKWKCYELRSRREIGSMPSFGGTFRSV